MTDAIRILIVEDSEDDAELVLLALRADGFAPVHCRVDSKAQMTKALSEEAWDIVLSDFSMPQFNAFDALDIRREAHADLPLIVVSGAVGEETAVRLIKAGADDFFVKGALQRLGGAVRRELRETQARIERKRAEEALRESEDRYRTTADAASDAIFTVNDQDVIVMANRAIERIFGYKPEEVAGKPLSMLLPSCELLPGECESSHRGGSELQGRHRDGHLIPLDVTFGAYSKEGALYCTGIARDVTERKLADAERERLFEQARLANRIKDEFLATLSHELRTPLYVIAGHSELLAMETPGSPEFQESLEAIRKHAKIQTQLINDLLDVSHIITGKLTLRFRPIDLKPVIEAAVETIKLAAAAKGIVIQILLEPGVGPVDGDADRLQQVFWNLLSNAVKFTPDGGRVAVRLASSEGRVTVDISDSGKGIEPGFLPYVFERFRQEDSSSTRLYGGLGLGLAIVRHILEVHGALIRVQSEGKGRGATFTVDMVLSSERLASLPDQSPRWDRTPSDPFEPIQY